MASKSEFRNLKRTLAGISFAALASCGFDSVSGQILNSSRVSGVPIRQIQPNASSAQYTQNQFAANQYAQQQYAQQQYAQQPQTSYGVQNYGNNAYQNAITDASQTANYLPKSVKVVAPADTSRQSERSAVASIPWDQLNPEGTRKLREIVDNPSIYRKLPVNQISCDPQFYTFSIRHPETIVNMWQVFGVTTMGLQRTGPYTFAGDDGAGTDCTAELIYGDANTHIYVGTGTYEGPVFRRKITGRCVAILKTNVSQGASQYDLTNQLDVFIKVDNLAADLIAKTLNPLVGRTADHNFRESLTFLQAFCDSATQDPNRVQYLAQKLNVDATTKSQFEQVISGIQDRQRQYTQAAATPASSPATTQNSSAAAASNSAPVRTAMPATAQAHYNTIEAQSR